MKHNLLLNSDAYKHSHKDMLDNDIAYMNSYLESRGGTFNKVYFFGLQYILKEYLTTPITQADLDYAFPILDTIGTG